MRYFETNSKCFVVLIILKNSYKICQRIRNQLSMYIEIQSFETGTYIQNHYEKY